jgi:SAM-dependent methyltransferase
MQFLIPPGKRVLELGCGRGNLLAALKPSYGVGIDFGAATIARAKSLHPELNFVLGDAEDPDTLSTIEGPFDYIVMADTIGLLEDIDGTLRLIHQLCAPSTRIVISYYSHLWEPILKTAEALHLRSKQPKINYVATADFFNLMDLADFEVISREQRQLLPRYWLGLGPFINRFIAPLPGIRHLGLRTYLVGRPVRTFPDRKLSASILIPCRNESGNIENAIKRMPRFGSAQEILFVEGNSSDGTFEECERVRDAYRDIWDIRVLKQDGKGKGDAVRKGFAAAKHDVLMILDADLTMPPEALPKYHAVIESGKAEFVNGTRLVYPMENEAMRPLNFIANRVFAYLFSYLVNTRLTDTLCGTKVLLRDNYEILARERDYFGNFDPFGDFDLIFGAAKQNLKIIETPIHYKARTFGETQISRFRDGWLLLKMVWFAYRKLKAI